MERGKHQKTKTKTKTYCIYIVEKIMANMPYSQTLGVDEVQ